MSAKKRTSTRLRNAARERMEHTGEKYTAALSAVRGAVDLGFPEGVGTLVRQEWVSSDDSGQVSFDTTVLLTVLNGTYFGFSQDIDVHTWLDGGGITSTVVLYLGEDGDYEERTVADVFGERAPLVSAWLESAYGDGPVYAPGVAEAFVTEHFPHANRETTILATALFEHVMDAENADAIDARIVHLTRVFSGLLDDGDEIERVSGGREVVDRLSDMTDSDRNIALSPLRSMLRALDESYAEEDTLPEQFGTLVSQVIEHDRFGLPTLRTTVRCSLDGLDQDVTWLTWDDDGLNTEGDVRVLGIGKIETQRLSPDEVYPAFVVGDLTDWIERSWARLVAPLPSGGLAPGSGLPHAVLSPSLPVSDVVSLIAREMEAPFDPDAFAAAAIKSLRRDGVTLPERIRRPIYLPGREYEPEEVSYAKNVVLDCVHGALEESWVEEYERSIELADAIIETLISAGVTIPEMIYRSNVSFDEDIDLGDGNVLVCGITGSGKSTLVQNIVRREKESGALIWSVPSEASWVDPSAITPPDWANASVTLEGIAKEVRRRYSQIESSRKSKFSEIGLPPIVAVIDWGFSISENELSRLADITQTSRGAGVRIIHAAQDTLGYRNGTVQNFPNRFLMGPSTNSEEEAMRIFGTKNIPKVGVGQGVYKTQSGKEGIVIVNLHLDSAAHGDDTRPSGDFVAR